MMRADGLQPKVPCKEVQGAISLMLPRRWLFNVMSAVITT